MQRGTTRSFKPVGKPRPFNVHSFPVPGLLTAALFMLVVSFSIEVTSGLLEEQTPTRYDVSSVEALAGQLVRPVSHQQPNNSKAEQNRRRTDK